MPLAYKISWALQACSFDTALLVTLVYWTVLHNREKKIFLLATEMSVCLLLLNFSVCPRRLARDCREHLHHCVLSLLQQHGLLN